MPKTDTKRDLYIDLFDYYVHSSEPRRVFLQKLVKAAGGVAAAAAVLPWLEGTGAEAAMVAPNDGRLTAGDVKFGKMTAYVARPKGSGKLPAVVVIHENRGLTPHIRDVARRVALEGFLAVAPDLISPLGGTPRNEDKARDMQDEIKKADHLKNLVATAKFAASHANSNGKVGCVGFCRGGEYANLLAIEYADLKAAVAYYGSQPRKGVEKINAAMLLHYASNDRGRTRRLKKYNDALKASGKTFESYVYPNTKHAFNHDGRPGRYNKAAAKLAWSRTIAFLKKYLS